MIHYSLNGTRASQNLDDALLLFRNTKNKALVQHAYSSNVVIGIFAGDMSSGAKAKGSS